jgi:hypothetical protein
MINAEIFGYIIKYKLPSSIQGSHTWHIYQLQDLLTMVKEFGMFHFFLTLIMNEMHKHRNIKNTLASCFFDFKS